jgi:hypothetical protein
MKGYLRFKRNDYQILRISRKIIEKGFFFQISEEIVTSWLKITTLKANSGDPDQMA